MKKATEYTIEDLKALVKDLIDNGLYNEACNILGFAKELDQKKCTAVTLGYNSRS